MNKLLRLNCIINEENWKYPITSVEFFKGNYLHLKKISYFHPNF